MKNQHFQLFGTVAAMLTIVTVVAYTQGAFAITSPPVPVILSVVPNSGPTAGGTSVAVSGSNFDPSDRVSFDGIPATVVSGTSTVINVVTPAHTAGPVNVAVANSNGVVTFNNGFTYIAPPPPPPVDENTCKKGKKVAICHLPPGNVENEHTLCLPDEAIPAHLAHGDYLGVCTNDRHDGDDGDDHNDGDRKSDSRKSGEENKKNSDRSDD